MFSFPKAIDESYAVPQPPLGSRQLAVEVWFCLLVCVYARVCIISLRSKYTAMLWLII